MTEAGSSPDVEAARTSLEASLAGALGKPFEDLCARHGVMLDRGKSLSKGETDMHVAAVLSSFDKNNEEKLLGTKLARRNNAAASLILCELVKIVRRQDTGPV